MVGRKSGSGWDEEGSGWEEEGERLGRRRGLNAMVYAHTILLIECPSPPSTINIQIGILLHFIVPTYTVFVSSVSN